MHLSEYCGQILRLVDAFTSSLISQCFLEIIQILSRRCAIVIQEEVRQRRCSPHYPDGNAAYLISYDDNFSLGEAAEVKRASDLLGIAWHNSASALLLSRLLGIFTAYYMQYSTILLRTTHPFEYPFSRNIAVERHNNYPYIW